MRQITKLPKTFLIYIETQGKSGYIKFNSYVKDTGGIGYTATLTKKQRDASKYVTLDNSKAKARAIKAMLSAEVVQVIDEVTKKSYVIH